MVIYIFSWYEIICLHIYLLMYLSILFRNADELHRGEFILADRPEVFLTSVATNGLAYIALHSTKVQTLD